MARRARLVVLPRAQRRVRDASALAHRHSVRPVELPLSRLSPGELLVARTRLGRVLGAHGPALARQAAGRGRTGARARGRSAAGTAARPSADRLCNADEEIAA